MTPQVTNPDLWEMKRQQQNIMARTAYDDTFARMVDAAGIDLILVGDPLGVVVQGRANTAAGHDGRNALPHRHGGARRSTGTGGGRHALHILSGGAVHRPAPLQLYLILGQSTLELAKTRGELDDEAIDALHALLAAAPAGGESGDG